MMKVNFIKSGLLFKYSRNLRDEELFKLFNISLGKKKQLDNNNIGKFIYKKDEKNKETKIFERIFVQGNKNRAKIILNNNQYNLVDKIKNEIVKMKFIIKIKFLENIIDIKCMFKKCEMLSSVKSFSKFNTKYLNIFWMLFITKNR